MGGNGRMNAAHTLPEGHEWLSDAFERAWLTIEDSEKHFLALSQRIPDEEFSRIFGGNWVGAPNDAWHAYDESRRRVERLMRTALASGRFRAMIRDARTGEPAEIANRDRWIDSVSFGVPGLRTELHHLACPGPETGGSPVFVRTDELDAFIRLQLPDLNSIAGANLIARTQWSLPALFERSSLDQLPDSDWLPLPHVLNVLSFGSLTPPAEMAEVIAAASRARTGAALLDQARQGKIEMFGTSATVGRYEAIPVAVFAHDLAVTNSGADLDIDPSRGDMSSYLRFRDATPHALRWHDVTISRASLLAWVSTLIDPALIPAARTPAPFPGTADKSVSGPARGKVLAALKAASSLWPADIPAGLSKAKRADGIRVWIKANHDASISVSDRTIDEAVARHRNGERISD